MAKSSVDNEKRGTDTAVRYYSLAYYLRSTALVMPALPIWWTQRVEIPVSNYLALMALSSIVPVLADVPLSYWADRNSPKLPYALGLAIFAGAFAATALLSGEISFYLYLIGIALGGALMSGADNAVLVDIVGEPDFSAAIYKLTHRFYLYTACLFILGVGLYTISPRLVFGAQAASLLAATLLIARIRLPAELSFRPSHKDDLLQFKRAFIQTKRFIRIALLLAVIGALFDGVSQFQNRSFQIMVYEATPWGQEDSNNLWVVAALLVGSNLLTAAGVSNRPSRRLRESSPDVAVLALSVTAIAALSGFAWGNLVGLSLGLILFSILKGCYRPYLSTLVSESTPNRAWKARWFSIVGVGTSTVSAAMNALLALFSGTARGTAISWLVFAVCAGPLLFVLLRKMVRRKFPITGGMSGKITYEERDTAFGRPSTVLQIYPKGTARGFVRDTSELAATNTLHSPTNVLAAGRRLRSTFFPGRALIDHDASNHSALLLETGIIKDLERRPALTLSSPGRARGTTRTHYAAQCAIVCQCRSLVHGDLHPGNILIDQNREYMVVDWDQAGLGARLLDESSLAFHPDLMISFDERISILIRLAGQHGVACPIKRSAGAVNPEWALRPIIASLLHRKLDDISEWGFSEDQLRLQGAYRSLLQEVLGESSTAVDH